MRRTLGNEHGIALITVLLVTVAIVTVAAGAIVMSSNTTLVNRGRDRLNALESAADAGLELARSRVNGSRSLYPDSGYNTLENQVVVYDGAGNPIPNIRRSLYVGPTGITSGQYGVFGSVVTDVSDGFGNRVVRRLEVVQESFSKYAYFTNVEPSNISFGGGDQIWGPVHTNDFLKIYSSGATFHGPVTTAKTIQGLSYGTFNGGYTQNVPRIEMPQTADLLKLQVQATAGNAAFIGNTNGGPGEATLRIEFIAVDLNDDGQVTGDNEGFFRIYRSTDPAWVVANVPADYSSNRMRNSEQCGHYHTVLGVTTFRSAKLHGTSGSDSWSNALTGAGRRCLLGGSDSLTGAFVPVDLKGQWLPYPGTVSPLVTAKRPADAAFLFPITRLLNPSFKGVIYVQGKVAVSGVVRGRVTVAATGGIIIADDITLATNPAAGTCADILGLFSGDDITVSDNTINAPVRPTSSTTYYTFDDTKDEFMHAVVLALSNFTVQNYSTGATTTEHCETVTWGRGCLYLTGGIIQETRGAVGTTSGTGNLKRYSYDACAFTDPPPYFPTTGHFARGRYFEVDPTGFSVAQYYALLTPAP